MSNEPPLPLRDERLASLKNTVELQDKRIKELEVELKERAAILNGDTRLIKNLKDDLRAQSKANEKHSKIQHDHIKDIETLNYRQGVDLETLKADLDEANEFLVCFPSEINSIRSKHNELLRTILKTMEPKMDSLTKGADMIREALLDPNESP